MFIPSVPYIDSTADFFHLSRISLKDTLKNWINSYFLNNKMIWYL